MPRLAIGLIRYNLWFTYVLCIYYNNLCFDGKNKAVKKKLGVNTNKI